MRLHYGKQGALQTKLCRQSDVGRAELHSEPTERHHTKVGNCRKRTNDRATDLRDRLYATVHGPRQAALVMQAPCGGQTRMKS